MTALGGSDNGTTGLPGGAVAPMRRFEAAVEEADVERGRSVEKARAALISDLRAAEKAALQRDDVDEATRIASLVKAQQTAAKAGITENAPTSSRPFVGQWHGRWRNSPDCGYTFTEDQFSSTGGASMKFTVEEGSVVNKYSSARGEPRQVDRFSPAGQDRLLMESWATWDDYAAGKPPSDFGLATRTRQGAH
jgi:hypothetical protein